MEYSIEIPQYFVCPISLQIMTDPVTAVTGITYDRPSIEHWLFSLNNTTCPVTNLPLPKDSHLTPNHTLRRLIQAWCTTNSVDRIPTPRVPVDPTAAKNLLQNLSYPNLHQKTLEIMANLVSESETNRRTIVQAGAAKSIVQVIISRAKNHDDFPIEIPLNLLLSLRVPSDELKHVVADNSGLLGSLSTILDQHESLTVQSSIMLVLKSVTELDSLKLLEHLNVDFFRNLIKLMTRDEKMTKLTLQVMLNCCAWGNNRTKAVEAGAVREIIELELNRGPLDKRRSELGFGVLDLLCGCADGRAQFVEHAAGIALVSDRIIRVSAVVDEAAVGILASVCKYNTAAGEVVEEMARVGAVAKLCMVMMAESGEGVREKARWVLRLHSGVWKKSHCVNFDLYFDKVKLIHD